MAVSIGHRASITIASYNILDPFTAVKWQDPAGLTEEAKRLSKETLDSSLLVNEEYGWKKYSNWGQRKRGVAKNIQLADIVCIQEISAYTLSELQPLIGKHKLASWVLHDKKLGSHQQFGNAIFYNPEKAVLLNSLSIPSGSPGAFRYAVCSNFVVAGVVLRVASLHLAGYNSKETEFHAKQFKKQNGYIELVNYMHAIEDDLEDLAGIITAGDFNEDSTEKNNEFYRPRFLESNGYQCDGSTSVSEPRNLRRIDYIYFKTLKHGFNPELRPMDIALMQAEASDHLMIGTRFLWKRGLRP